MTVREDIASVDSANFYGWSKRFVEDCKALTDQGRKVFMLLGFHRLHMRLKALNVLDQGRIVVYAWSSHTRGVTQPLHVVIFCAFKVHLRNLVEPLSSSLSKMFSIIHS